MIYAIYCYIRLFFHSRLLHIDSVASYVDPDLGMLATQAAPSCSVSGSGFRVLQLSRFQFASGGRYPTSSSSSCCQVTMVHRSYDCHYHQPLPQPRLAITAITFRDGAFTAVLKYTSPCRLKTKIRLSHYSILSWLLCIESSRRLRMSTPT